MRVLGVIVALAICGVVASSAHAAGHSHFPASITTTVPPGGNSAISSPTLDPGQKSATVELYPSTEEDDTLFRFMHWVLAPQPTKKRRLLVCVGIFLVSLSGDNDDIPTQALDEPDPRSLLLLAACLALAAQIDRAEAQSHAAAASCQQSGQQIPASFERVGKGFTMSFGGEVSDLSVKTKTKVTCKRKGKGMRLKIRPRQKGKTLRSVVGPKLMVGLYNTLDAPSASSVKVTFRR